MSRRLACENVCASDEPPMRRFPLPMSTTISTPHPQCGTVGPHRSHMHAVSLGLPDTLPRRAARVRAMDALWHEGERMENAGGRAGGRRS